MRRENFYENLSLPWTLNIRYKEIAVLMGRFFGASYCKRSPDNIVSSQTDFTEYTSID